MQLDSNNDGVIDFAEFSARFENWLQPKLSNPSDPVQVRFSPIQY